jgi:hypothetical protein
VAGKLLHQPLIDDVQQNQLGAETPGQDLGHLKGGRGALGKVRRYQNSLQIHGRRHAEGPFFIILSWSGDP